MGWLTNPFDLPKEEESTYLSRGTFCFFCDRRITGEEEGDMRLVTLENALGKKNMPAHGYCTDTELADPCANPEEVK